MSNSDAVLVVEDLTAQWDARSVVERVSFHVAPGELLVLMGPNGSGKTTLLRAIAGFERPAGGRVLLGGDEITNTPVHRRGIGLLFQEPALFPQRSVWENVAYGPLVQRLERAEVARRVDEVVALLQLGTLVDRRPDQLSGGERQRVALARTLAARPRLILLDEPFASIDAEIKTALRADFRNALHRLGLAAVHVTHDREEGLFLGDRVAILMDGRLHQLDTPRAIYETPADESVARFLGYNVIHWDGRMWAVEPRAVRLTLARQGRLDGRVLARGYAPDGYVVEVETTEGLRLELQRASGGEPPPVGSIVGIDWDRAVQVPTGPR